MWGQVFIEEIKPNSRLVSMQAGRRRERAIRLPPYTKLSRRGQCNIIYNDSAKINNMTQNRIEIKLFQIYFD